MAKRKCNHVDITDISFIENCIEDCIAHKTAKQMRRRDIRALYEEYPTNHAIAVMIQKELLSKKLHLEPIRYEEKIDRSNGKLRRIAIECIKQQIYDYIASNALEDIKSRIGYYQVACVKGKGSLMGVMSVYQWLQDPDVKYGIKSDIKQCYHSITHRNMMQWLKRHVKNDMLLWLINELLNTVEEGLPIGSMLSITLSALYLSDLYHHLEDSYFTERRGKKHNIVLHKLFNLDDIYIFGSNAKAMNRMMHDFIIYANSYGLTIKLTWQLIDLTRPDAQIDVLGYKVYKDHITMRKRNYKKLKHSMRVFEAHPSVRKARSLCSLSGNIKHTDSLRFCQKYNYFKLLREAKKVVSDYDKRNFFRKTADSQGNGFGRGELLPNLS